MTALKFEERMNADVDHQKFFPRLFLQFLETFQVCPLARHSNHPRVTSMWQELL